MLCFACFNTEMCFNLGKTKKEKEKKIRLTFKFKTKIFAQDQIKQSQNPMFKGN